MAETNVKNDSGRLFKVRHRGRFSQIGIYFTRQMVMFIYQSDWKVLPMAALIAGLVGMVIRNRLFINMEGTLMGGFALVMVCIWNGCFNSIQVICRERDVVKREHRSGMHISSYVVSHMMYQALLCLMQTVVTLYVTRTVGVKYPAQGLFTPWMIVDFGISLFLITYASDMMSLWISSLAHTTTTAMTIMPFVLIFQLVFSGGMLSLPSWTNYITPFTISNPALKVVAAQGDYNHRPVMTIWNQVNKMRNREVSATVSLGQVFEVLQNEGIEPVANLRAQKLTQVIKVGELRQMLETSETFKALRQQNVLDNFTVRDLITRILENDDLKAVRDVGFPGASLGKLLEDLLKMDKLQSVLDQKIIQAVSLDQVLKAVDLEGLMNRYADEEIGEDFTIGQLVDLLAENPDIKAHFTDSFTANTTVGGLIDILGEDKVQDVLQNRIAEASYDPVYENSIDNILGYWLSLLLFVFAFAALAIITLEFIDKDKR